MSSRIVDILSECKIKTDPCERFWVLAESHEIQPLYFLADADRADSSLNTSGWNFCCQKHNQYFSVEDDCPKSVTTCRAGDRIELDLASAAQLVRMGLAEYPTHAQPTDKGLQETLDRANALMDDLDLPHLDEESMRTVSVKGRRGQRHYRRPRDGNLANDLGLSLDDIAEMRGLAKGDANPE